MKEYAKAYEKFLEEYRNGSQSGREIGEAATEIVRHYFAVNDTYSAAKMAEIEASIRYKARRASIAEGTDPATGKPLAIGKAEILSEATDEYADWQRAVGAVNAAKREVSNCEQLMESMKVLQYGVAQEQKYVGAS